MQSYTFDEIIEYMQGKELSSFTDTVVRVISSKDRAKRIIVLQSDHGYYKVVYEQIHIWDEDEWNYYGSDPNRYPAYWEQVGSSMSSSIFGTEKDTIKAIHDSCIYKTHFA